MAEPKKRCLYEILNVSRDCSQDEIRSAYRRLALQLHPDKLAAQSADSAASTAAFQELQHAYEVLSDPKERQFYDSHRSQILFSSPTQSSKSSSFDIDLFSFFSTSAFSGFGDTGKGFFKVYGDVFGKIYAQELYFVKELGLDQDLVKPAPMIGNLESPYSQVTAFYNYWLGFCTVLDFAWVDEFAASLGVNRRSRRAMEEENKKRRKKARREYNDLVRDLAAFAKKRDKRVKDMQLKKSLEEEKRREEEKARKKEEERRKMEMARLYEEPEWAKIDDDDDDEDRVFDEMDNENDMGKKKGKGGEEFYCVVCNKKFKSDKQWKNHEQSKKHKEKVAELRISFQEEEEEEEEEGLDIGETRGMEDGNVVDELCEELKDDLGLEEEGLEDGDMEDVEKELGSDDEASILEAMISGRKNRKSDYLGRDDSVTDRGSRYNDEESYMGHDTRKGRRNRASRRGTDADGGAGFLRGETSQSWKDESEVQNRDGSVEEPKEEASCSSEGVAADGDAECLRQEASGSKPDEAEVRNHDDNVEEPKEEISCSFEGVAAKGKGEKTVGKNQKHKKQQVDVRGPAKKENSVSKNTSKGKKQKGSTKAPSNACETCGESFDTRNKLFAHLGDTGHASLKAR